MTADASVRTTRRPRRRGARRLDPLVGGFFAVCAAGNAVGTMPAAGDFLRWCRDTSWLPPYRAVLDALVPHATVVVGAAVVFEVGVAAGLLGGRYRRVALYAAAAWVFGLIPAIGFPYWVVNVPLGIAFLALARVR